MLRNFPRTGSVTSKDFFKEVIGKDPRELADKHKFLLKKKKKKTVFGKKVIKSQDIDIEPNQNKDL